MVNTVGGWVGGTRTAVVTMGLLVVVVVLLVVVVVLLVVVVVVVVVVMVVVGFGLLFLLFLFFLRPPLPLFLLPRFLLDLFCLFCCFFRGLVCC